MAHAPTGAFPPPSPSVGPDRSAEAYGHPAKSEGSMKKKRKMKSRKSITKPPCDKMLRASNPKVRRKGIA